MNEDTALHTNAQWQRQWHTVYDGILTSTVPVLLRNKQSINQSINCISAIRLGITQTHVVWERCIDQPNVSECQAAVTPSANCRWHCPVTKRLQWHWLDLSHHSSTDQLSSSHRSASTREDDRTQRVSSWTVSQTLLLTSDAAAHQHTPHTLHAISASTAVFPR